MCFLDTGEVYFVLFEYGGEFSQTVVVYAIWVHCSYFEPIVAEVHCQRLWEGTVCGDKVFSLDFIYGFFNDFFSLGGGKSIVLVKFCI